MAFTFSVFFSSLWIAGHNGRIEYSITAGDDNNDFEIIQNGTIRTKRMLDRETISTYNLVITARDCAKEPERQLSSTVQVSYKYCYNFSSDFIVFFFKMLSLSTLTWITKDRMQTTSFVK